MTNQEVMQKFAAAVNVQQLRQDFPDIEWVITQLVDGQQEIVIRVQGADPDFHPGSDYTAIDNLTYEDIPDEYPVRNGIVLRKLKKRRYRQRKKLLYKALLKRVRVLLQSAGVKPAEFIRTIKSNLPSEGGYYEP